MKEVAGQAKLILRAREFVDPARRLFSRYRALFPLSHAPNMTHSLRRRRRRRRVLGYRSSLSSSQHQPNSDGASERTTRARKPRRISFQLTNRTFDRCGSNVIEAMRYTRRCRESKTCRCFVITASSFRTNASRFQFVRQRLHGQVLRSVIEEGEVGDGCGYQCEYSNYGRISRFHHVITAGKYVKHYHPLIIKIPTLISNYCSLSILLYSLRIN